MSKKGENYKKGSTLHFCPNRLSMLQSFYSKIRSFIFVAALLISMPVIEVPDYVLAQQKSDDAEMEEALSGFNEEDSGIEEALSGFDEEILLWLVPSEK